MRTRFIAIGGLIAASVFWMSLQSGADEARNPDNAAAELVDTAKNALRSTMAAHTAGRATIEDIYQWSRRLMTAEQAAGKAGASAAHLERMDALHKKAEALYQTASKGGSEDKFYAAKFYFLEAQAMNTAK